MIDTYRFGQITLNGSGAATAVSTRPLNGGLMAISFAQQATPGTPTIVVSVSDGLTTNTILTLASYTTTAVTWHYVRAASEGQTGTAALYAAAGTGVLVQIPIDGYVTITISGGAAGHTVDCSVQTETC